MNDENLVIKNLIDYCYEGRFDKKRYTIQQGLIGDYVYLIYDNEKDRYNLINIFNCELLCDVWYCHIGRYFNDYFYVTRNHNLTNDKNGITNGIYNFIDRTGKLINVNWFSWFCWVSSLSDGIAIVKFNDEFYTLDMKGNLSYCAPELSNKYIV